jgi:pyruvate/2-oxoglutarate dehydrogenase complex dihydrolipoamide dehydrogenase (E3) component
VHLLEPSDHVMSREDRDAAEIVQNRMIRDGVKLYTQMKVVKVERRGGDKIVSIDQGGRTTEIACDAILVAAGRAPNVEGLGLEAAGVTYDPKLGVQVDDSLQTSNKRIYAAGDVSSKYKFTHAADFLARTVIENALFKTGLLSIAGRKKASTLTIPWCTYTDPEIAHVGAYERELQEKGIPHRTFTQEYKEVDRAILDGEDDGFVRVHVDAKTDKILGATIVAKQAGDMINELTLAMVNGIGLGSIAKVIHPYPTRGEAIRKVGDQFNRTRLTPKAKAFTTWLMARRR